MSETAANATPTRLERLSRAHERQLVEIQGLREKLADSQKIQDKLTKDNQALLQAVDESVAIKRVNELEGELRGVKHRKVLDKIATSKGLNPEAVDGFYALSKYQADGEPDEAKITAFVEAKKAELGYLFTPPADPNAAPIKPANGSGQGSSAAVNSFALKPEDPRVNDIKYQMENYAAIQNAKVEQLARGELR